MALDEASVRFLDGMRVATEHMRHLQRASIERARELRETLGAGKVCYGLKVDAGSDRGELNVSPGLAIDGFGRPIVVHAPVSVVLEGDRAFLIAVYDLRASLLVNGVPTLLANGARIEARSTQPPYDDGAVRFAEVAREAAGDQVTVRVVQKGEWYLPPLDHGHSGEFFTDALGRWRHDGPAIGGSAQPRFDSGFVPIAAGESLRIRHGLQSTELAIELAARRSDGAITNRGVGTDYWFELPSEDEIALVRAAADGAPPLVLRARVWLLGATAGDLVRPIADAGDDRDVGPGASFHLDATRSRAVGARRLVRYVWTQLS